MGIPVRETSVVDLAIKKGPGETGSEGEEGGMLGNCDKMGRRAA